MPRELTAHWRSFGWEGVLIQGPKQAQWPWLVAGKKQGQGAAGREQKEGAEGKRGNEIDEAQCGSHRRKRANP